MPHTQLDIRILVTRRLLMLRESGRLTTAHVQAAARAAGASERTLWRWLQDGRGTHANRPRARYALTDADWDAYDAWRGSAAAAWRQQRAAGASMPSLRTFQAAIARELLPGQRAAISSGVEVADVTLSICAGRPATVTRFGRPTTKICRCSYFRRRHGSRVGHGSR